MSMPLRVSVANDVASESVVIHHPDSAHLRTESWASATAWLSSFPPARPVLVLIGPAGRHGVLTNSSAAPNVSHTSFSTTHRYVHCCPVPLYFDTGIGSIPGLIRALYSTPNK